MQPLALLLILHSLAGLKPLMPCASLKKCGTAIAKSVNWLATNAPLVLELLREVVAENECLLARTSQTSFLFATTNTNYGNKLELLQPPHDANNDTNTLRFLLQIEDSLVDEERALARGTLDGRLWPGAVPLMPGWRWSTATDHRTGEPAQVAAAPRARNYTVRIVGYPAYSKVDVVVEYTRTNVENMRLSGHFEHELRRVVYVPPLLWPFEPPKRLVRPIDVLATFTPTSVANGSYRAAVLARFRRAGVAVRLVGNVFEPTRLRDLLDKSKILIDIRQAPGYDTMNEFRILP
eukprot:6447535-Prymnesium_polylepis.1